MQTSERAIHDMCVYVLLLLLAILKYHSRFCIDSTSDHTHI